VIVKLSKAEIEEAVAEYVRKRLPVTVKGARVSAYEFLDSAMVVYAEVDIVEDPTFHEGGPYR
jgi:hypothetical protein